MTIRNVVARGFGPGAAIKFVATRGFTIGAAVVTPPNASLATRGFGLHGSIGRLVIRYYNIGSVVPPPPTPTPTVIPTGGGGGIRRRHRSRQYEGVDPRRAALDAAIEAAIEAVEAKSGPRKQAIQGAVAAAQQVAEADEREVVSHDDLGELTRVLLAVVNARKAHQAVIESNRAIETARALLAEIHRRRLEEDDDDAVSLLMLH